MQSTPIHSVCHSICEGLLLGPYSSGRPMFLGSPQPSQQNHGKQSIPQWFSAVVLCCIHLMFLLLLFFFCSGCTSNFSHCESIITSRVANTKNILDIFRPCYAKCTVFAAFGRIYHGRIEVADGIFHSLQLLGYLTQEQDIQNSCSMLFQYPSVFAWKHLRIHEKFGSACEEKLWRSKPSKSALSIEP